MTVLLVILLLCGGPEGFILTLSGDEFLLKWNLIGRILEDFECSKASSQCGVPIEPLVMNGTQSTVTAIDLCGDKQLVALTNSARVSSECKSEEEM